MTRAFAEAVAFMIWADIYNASLPAVVSGMRDVVFLDHLADRRTAADKLAGWLGDLLGGRSGITPTCEGWSVWATREDGAIFEASVFGYRLYKTQHDDTRGDPLIGAAPRHPIEAGGGVA